MSERFPKWDYEAARLAELQQEARRLKSDLKWESLPDRPDDWMPDGRLTWADAVGRIKGRAAGDRIIKDALYETIHEYLIGREHKGDE